MLNTLQVRDYMIRDPFLLSPSMSVTDAIAVLLAPVSYTHLTLPTKA